MLRILGSARHFCDGVTRREMLQVGGAGLMGLGLSDLISEGGSAAPSVIGSTADMAETFGKAKHCIILFLYGSPSQLETFDPKPNAPVDIRGPFQSIPTSIPGVRISEHLNFSYRCDLHNSNSFPPMNRRLPRFTPMAKM